MASHGSGGNKFVSVNLNKSFGQSLSYNYNRSPYNNNNNGSYGQAASSRVRSGGVRGGAGGSGDGMVVLSRPRSSQKVTSKLSVPSPLNLPSMRKEHEKIDFSGPGSGLAGGSGTGSGSRPTVSSVGWTKPGVVALHEKDDALVADRVDQSVQGMDGVAKGSSSYMPPSARMSGVGVPSGQSYVRPAEKAMVLRGEDFPPLKAALPVTSEPSHKQKDNMYQKQRPDVSEESSNGQRDYNDLHSPVHMRPQGQYNYSANLNGTIAIGGEGRRSGGSANIANRTQKQDDFPLPLVRFNPRSDWADDERDTGHVSTDYGRDNGLARNEAYWDRDFDILKTSVLQKHPNSTFEKQILHGDNSGKGPSGEVRKVDPYHRRVITSTQEGNNWRTNPLQNDGINMHEVSTGVNGSAQPMGLNRDNVRGNKYVIPRLGVGARDSGLAGIGESAPGRKDRWHEQEKRQHWNLMVESGNQGSEQKHRFGAEKAIRYRVDAPQNKTVSKFSVSSSSKGLSVNDPILNCSRQKLHLPKSDRPYLEEPLPTDFGEKDPFSGGIVGVIKRKKEVINQVDLHDPVRESFEAELERVQKMQEMERQRIIEEQERILKQARREEEERQRMIQEDEERRIRLEEEAQEAAWKAEQERLEVIRRAEEQKIAREEEKRRMSIEEERRKHAAKQKLLELEAKIAQRHAEAQKSDSSFAAVQNEKVSSGTKEKDMIGEADLDDWEDSERMVERITTSASSDSSARNRPFVTSSRLPPLVKSSSGFLERGKTVNALRKDVIQNGTSSSVALQDQDYAHLSPRRDASVGERAFLRKESYSGAGFPNAYSKGGLQETHLGEYTHTKDNRWNLFKNGDPFNKNRGTGSESYENVSERYDDIAWEQGHNRGNLYSAYPERVYPNAETDELYSYGRSRYFMKQPRVLPPPSIKSSFRGENEHPGPSSSLGVDLPYSYIARSESAPQTGYHDESDESGDSPAMLPVSAVEKVVPLTENDSIVFNKSGEDIIMTASSSITAGEDEEWTLDTNEKMQEQEEYDEDGYQEEDEVHEVDDENIDLTCEFEIMHLDDKDSSDVMDNLVLGFDEGVEVRLPDDEFDRNLNCEGNNRGMPEVSFGIVEDQGSVDGKRIDPEKFQPVDCFPQTDTEIALERIDRPEQTIQGTVMPPINDPPTSVVCDLLNDTNTFCPGLSSMSTTSSSVHTASHFPCSQPVVSVASSSPNLTDLPVKLQFGLFTGPSLIPSPVPAIQIGSIQMPLHLHLPLDPSITHLHTSQPPLFQFGQLGYTAPVSQGILPMASQSMSSQQPSIQHHYNVNQDSGGSMPNQFDEHTHTQHLLKDNVSSISMNSQPAVVSKALDLSDENRSGVLSSFPVRGSAEGSIAVHRSGIEVPRALDNNYMSNSVSQAEDKVLLNSVIKTVGQSNAEGSQSRPTDKFVSREKGNVLKGEGSLIGNKEKNLPYVQRNYGGRSFSSHESSYSDSRGFQRRPRRAIQRTEFRVRQSSSLFPSKNSGLDDKLNSNDTVVEIPTRSGYKRGTITHKSLKQVVDSESLNSGPISSQEIDTDSKSAKERAKDALPKSRGIPFSREGNMKMNISEDVDASSQSGVVHVFKQSGIETPSDEDDFIEVRSKRQMLNDRREQREKEFKAKSRVTKLSRKPRTSSQSTMISSSSKKNYVPLGGETSNNTQIGSASEGQGKEVSIGFTPMTSQQLAPIGTPTLNTDSTADCRAHTKSSQAAAVPVVSGGGKEIGRGLIYENKNKVLDTVQAPLGSWGNARISQQVMALTQNQLDEAMKPVSFETNVASIGGHTTSEIMLASSSSLTKDKPMSSSASPINSLLAGEKIQFGAVTSPTVLPPTTSRVTSIGIGAPGSFLSNVKMSQNISGEQSNSSLCVRKGKCRHESCGKLENCEYEAEAAASAVAVAAISSDKIVVSGLSSVSISDAKNFGSADVHGIVEGVSDDQQIGIQSRVEESLSVSLPADLSVETPPISSWPPLPSPQNSTSTLAHFPVAPPSHFPFYEMNPMLGGPIFAFGPIEESGGSQSQSQKNPVSGPGPIGTWQQFHPTMDPFYGPPTGFNGPFINPPGVQAPSQMLVYNHYARVGQFGQVGLSFMGTTYIPSGKQPDWKHNPTSSAMGSSDGDMNMISAQRNPPNMPAPMPHLAPGPPILPMPMGSPMAMFDVSPFQSAPDMAVQGRWSHVPASPLPSVPITLPLQQQTEGVPPSKFSHGHPVEQLRANRSQTFAPSDSNRSVPVVADARDTRSVELGLVDTSTNTVHQSSSESVTANTGKSEAVQNGSSNTSNGHSTNSFKPQHSQQKNLSSQQYNNTTGYGYQRGGASQKNSSAGEWSHRRMGFHGRNHSLGAEKTLANSKVRQIYVAKQTKGSSTTD